jgi:hypothetical protein
MTRKNGCGLGRWVVRRGADGTGSGSRPKEGIGISGVPIFHFIFLSLSLEDRASVKRFISVQFLDLIDGR